MLNKIKKISINQEMVVYVIAVAFMIIPFFIATLGGTEQYISIKQEGFGFWKSEKEVISEAANPFVFGALTALLGCLVYTIVLFRNKETLFLEGNEKKLNIKMIVLHLANLLFTTSVFAILPSDISLFGMYISSRAILVFALILSLLSIKSLSGILWIIMVCCILPSLTKFDKWRLHGYIYIILSYISLICQFFILKVFKFNINQVLIDIGIIGNQIKNDVSATIDDTKKIVDTTAKVAVDTVEKVIKI